MTLGEVAGVAERLGGGARDARLLDPVWHGKVQDKPGSAVSLVPAAMMGEMPAPSSIQAFFGDFAVARADDWARRRASLFLLFKSGGAWRVAGEACAVGAAGDAAPFDPRTAERDVLGVLDVYYRAVEAGDSAPLRDIFHAHWHMKNHEDGVLVAEDKAAFIRRIEAGPTKGYNRDRHVADVQVLFDTLAYVRIDKPSTPGVTVFLLFKTEGAWAVVDKAWSMARA